MLTELARGEKEAGILPEKDVDVFMKVGYIWWSTWEAHFCTWLHFFITWMLIKLNAYSQCT
jgi:hypothetical protein